MLEPAKKKNQIPNAVSATETDTIITQSSTVVCLFEPRSPRMLLCHGSWARTSEVWPVTRLYRWLRRNSSLLHSHIESGVATSTSRYGPNEGCDVLTVRAAIHTQPTGIPIHRNTLPTAIISTSRTAIGLVAIVRRRDARSRSTPVVPATRQRLLGNRRGHTAQMAPCVPDEAKAAGSCDAFQAHAASRGSRSHATRRCRRGR